MGGLGSCRGAVCSRRSCRRSKKRNDIMRRIRGALGQIMGAAELVHSDVGIEKTVHLPLPLAELRVMAHNGGHRLNRNGRSRVLP